MITTAKMISHADAVFVANTSFALQYAFFPVQR